MNTAIMNNTNTISRLNNLLTAEVEAVLVYIQHHFIVKDNSKLQLELFEISLDEMRHIQWLADLIVELGGEPELAPRKLRFNGKELNDIILHEKMLEYEAIESYRKFLEEITISNRTISNSNIPLGKIDPNSLKVARVLKHIKEEEEDHLEKFQMLCKESEVMKTDAK